MRQPSTILGLDPETSAWDDVLGWEPYPHRTLSGAEVDRALAAMGRFADLVSPYLAGHSMGVAELAAAAADSCGVDPTVVLRAGLKRGPTERPGPPSRQSRQSQKTSPTAASTRMQSLPSWRRPDRRCRSSNVQRA